MAKFAFFMDPFDSLIMEKDTTLQIIKNGILKGHNISVFHDDDLMVRNGKVIVNTKRVQLIDEEITRRKSRQHAITDYDMLFVRRDPPVTIEFYTSLSILSSIEDELICLNSPASILTFPEKIWPATFKKFHPPTIITKSIDDILSFKKEHGSVVIKPLYNYCGNGIYVSLAEDRNLNSIITLFMMTNNLPILVQKFITSVEDGDRRIIMLGGKAVGAINRKSNPNDFRCNMYAGGTTTLHTLSATEMDICSHIGPLLMEKKLHLVGVDIIGNYITEINTTAPTGVFQIFDLGGPNLSKKIIEYAEGLLI